MIRLGLIGYPLEHSLSPELHRAALQACGLPGEYLLYPVLPDDRGSLAKLLSRLRTGELLGLNVTVPYKQAVIPLLDDLSAAARAAGAVNTVFLRDGRLCGENTDAPGFLTDLARFLPQPRSAIVLGAGGAARAVVLGLVSLDCKVTLAARRSEQAHELARRFEQVNVIGLNRRDLAGLEADLLVNTTPVGMFPQANVSPWPDGLAFPRGTAVYDLVYNPRETLLIKEARLAGLRATTGLGMLVEQAALAFELWTGQKAARSIMLDSLKQIAC